MTLRRSLIAVLALVAGPALAAVATAVPARSGGGDARIAGTFAMSGRIIRAVDVRGERTGEVVRRTWRISGARCGAGGVCARLRLLRERPGASTLVAVLNRVGRGSYRGSAVFSSPLVCLGRTYAHGLISPYVLSVQVTRRVAVGHILYATGLRASYDNPARRDTTPCPLAPASDAARYVGRLRSALPTPPRTTTTPPRTTTTTTTSATFTIPTPTTATAPGSTTTTTPLL